MKKSYLFSALCFLLALSAVGQTSSRIVVLAPSHVDVSDAALQEPTLYASTIDGDAQFARYTAPEQCKLVRAGFIETLKAEYLQLKDTQPRFRIQNQRDAISWLHVNEATSPKAGAYTSVYKQIAEKYQADWVINYSSLQLTQQEGKPVIEAHIQIYNRVSDGVWIDKDYRAENCLGNSAGCIVNDLVQKTASDLYGLLAQKRHYWEMQAKSN